MSSRTFDKPLARSSPERRTHGGRVYASIIEANRAAELDVLRSNGDVRWWIPQVTFDLGPAFRYRVDFLVAWEDHEIQAEDVKGFDKPRFREAVRFWKQYGPIPLVIVRPKGQSQVIQGGRE